MDKTNNESLLHDRFEMRKKIGTGGLGVVRLAYDFRSQKEVAIKSEITNNDFLSRENEVYQALKDSNGFPTMYDYFQEGKKKYLAMTLLGPSIKSQFSKNKNVMYLKKILEIADQLIDRLETLHGLGYVHRDIKPENMAMGLGASSSTLHLFDFGLAKKFKVGNLYDKEEHCDKLVGTSRYASLKSHKGIELSRRDDLESMAYTLIYLRKGFLPWQGFKDHKDYTYSHVYREKMRPSPQDLCHEIEHEFCELLLYARNLTYTEKPDYAKIKKIFRDLYEKKAYDKTELINKRFPKRRRTESIEEIRKRRRRESTVLVQDEYPQRRVFYSLLRMR